MSDPVILYGTQNNGETLPVQVDQFGRLVAEGLPGSEGPPGPPGADGVNGQDGGSFPLPPDPYEGALLGWLNNGLAWIGTPPIPIPEDVFGPISEWNPDSDLLTVEGPIPDEVSTGVFVWQVDAQGDLYTAGWKVGAWTSILQTPSTGLEADKQLIYGFDGNPDTEVSFNDTNEPIVLMHTFEGVDRIQGRIGANSSAKGLIEVFGVNADKLLSYQTDSSGQFDLTLSNKTVGRIQVSRPASRPGIYFIDINGERLVDSSLSLNLRVNQVYGNSLVGIANVDVPFSPGAYLKVPEQRVAPWVLYGNDPTLIIDHLRQTRD